ncbi:MAG: 30S ribosomal protein S9, partial [Alphaproteobacteria bacterium]|nr:30S ribosomal protein S9 [Alphaproteobacteria bacterium]
MSDNRQSLSDLAQIAAEAAAAPAAAPAAAQAPAADVAADAPIAPPVSTMPLRQQEIDNLGRAYA